MSASETNPSEVAFGHMPILEPLLPPTAADTQHPQPPRHRVPSSNTDLAGAAVASAHGNITRLVKSRVKHWTATFTIVDWISVFIPAAGWLSKYKWDKWLTADLIAGITVGIMAVPEAISYANLAGLPSEFGMTATLVPCIIYALFGSSRQLAVGPVAMMCLLLSSGMIDNIDGQYDNEDPNRPANPEAQHAYNTAAIQISLIAGLMFLAAGALHLGFLTQFLSHSVKYFLGVEISRHWSVVGTTEAILRHEPEWEWQEAAMGLTFLAIVVTMKHFGRQKKKWAWMRSAGPLLVTVLGIASVWAFGLDKKGIKTVGKVEAGLPRIYVQRWFPLHDPQPKVLTAGIITLVALMESIAVAKTLADRNNYSISPNRELVGLGMANAAGAVFGACPVSGSFSRSAVSNDSGARTGLTAVFTGALVAFVMAFIMPVFALLPMNVLAAIITASLFSNLEISESTYLFKINKLDWVVWMTSFLGTVFLGVEIGLSLAIGLALLLVIYESAFPGVPILGRLPESTIYRNKDQYPNAEVDDRVTVMRIDAPIYFANVEYILDFVRSGHQKEQDPDDESCAILATEGLRFLVIDMSAVTYIDTAGLRGLEALLGILQANDIQLLLANPSHVVMTMMDSSGLTDLIGREHLFVEVHDAVQHAHEDIERISMELRNRPQAPRAGSISLHGRPSIEYLNKMI
ncbi:hypothetical protein WJX74_005548 [Apatococcus lobatus]|uniref:STAS domain-containing protein n=1 Tax=Apatococcus lobatus TaxID=904363 RepID=A0AAW1RLT0_9CHLO